jgi:very-short-patch-repair endonuclease
MEMGAAGPVGDGSIFQSNLPLGDKLERARMELLDLSARNRLLNMPRGAKGARSIDVIDEKSDEVFRLLAREGKAFAFVAGREATGDGVVDREAAELALTEADEITDLAQPEDESTDERGVFRRHTDTKLQTRLTGKGLQKRLLEMYLDSRTLEEEQGVNVLFLTLGALKWVDPNNAANIRYAPLLLVPVALDRGNAGERFNLKARQEDFASNLSLEAYLDRVHALRMPGFEANDAFDVTVYFNAVADVVQTKADWQVLPDAMSIGFFSFAKFLMYRDLDPAVWPANGKITERPLIRGLLSDGFAGGEGMADEDVNIDPLIPPIEMLHILDCDSSQALAVHEVRNGRDIVIQGPPGTGKSQTIANVIASAIKDGKTVLFVAEKMAALDVVKRRLDEKGVGDACLELHSNKANKRAVLEELRRTWELGAPRGADPGSLFARLTEARDELNRHVERLHAVERASGLSPYRVIGQLTRLRQVGERANDIVLVESEKWGADGFERRHDLLADLASRVEEIGKPSEHAWFGVDLAAIIPTDVERLVTRVQSLATHLTTAVSEFDVAAHIFEADAPRRLSDVIPLIELCRRVSDAPHLSGAAMEHAVWNEPSTIESLLAEGRRYQAAHSALLTKVTPDAWETDVTEMRQALDELPPDFEIRAFERLEGVTVTLPRILAEGAGLARVLGRDAPGTVAELDHLARVGERVASAPPASPETFASDLWNDGLERAGHLANAVAILEGVRQTVQGQILDVAWDVDLDAARLALAARGTSMFRFLSGEWRTANRLVRSVIRNPDQPLPLTLALLDTLSRGQKARRAISEEDSFGRSAFGDDWRAERSDSAPLLALVEWMKSLRGLGAEPRLIAARSPDQPEVLARSRDVAGLTAALFAQLKPIWSDLSDVRSFAFGNVGSPDKVDLSSFLQLAVRFSTAKSTAWPLFLSAPGTAREAVIVLDDLVAGCLARDTVRERQSFGIAAFDTAWQDETSNWEKLITDTAWMRANTDIRALAGRVGERTSLVPRAHLLSASSAHALSTFRALAAELNLDTFASVGALDAKEALLDVIRWRLQRWVDEHEQLSRWVAYRDRAAKATLLGCGDLVARLSDGRLPPPGVVPALEMAYFEITYARMVRAAPELGRFDGVTHGRLVREFAELDRQRIAAASIEVVKAHHKLMPPRDGGSVGPLGVLRGEIQKKKGHIPIRKLVERAGPALKALKPVFMMSPLSVAQFLPPGAMEFDLLVMDEASQIQPVDALGAVARAKQVVVVGDPKQLPPTSFFAKMTNSSGDEDDDDDATPVADIESILGLFTARGLPMRMLRWHYRSRHQSLIAVSNRQFYENKLFIVPSPYTAGGGRGLRFHHVPDGLFDAGNKRNNLIEAKVVARAIVEHARQFPKLSLGVAAFSAAQRRAIIDELEILRRELPPEIEEFFRMHRSEPFFIKNLENVQGDERDVIFISVGYGRSTLSGRIPMRFGPLGTEGGERRLNVLISRAKQRCDVFASMTDEDIDTSFAATRKGVFAFRMFLQYARTGHLVMAESTGRDFDSIFEEQVAFALRARGYTVQAQVGLAGFFIDLAIIDDERPGRFLLGIECDGAAYHSGRSARDRDRLRQSVLEDHGWAIQRIWSSDWFQRPAEQLDLVIKRIEAARVEFDQHKDDAELASRLDEEAPYVERESEPDSQEALFTAYIEAVLTRPAHRSEDLHETPQGILTDLAIEAVTIEGPVHMDEVTVRIRDAWGLKRAGSRIEDAVGKSVDIAVRTARLQRNGDFLSVPGAPVIVRDRSQVVSTALRKAEMLPPAELIQAALTVVRANFGATREQVTQSVGRGVGIRSISSQVRGAISAAVDVACKSGQLCEMDGMLTIGADAN